MKIFGINGPILTIVDGMYQMSEIVHIGEHGIIGEVIFLNQNQTIVQAFEDTEGLRPGDKVIGSGQPLSAKLGPGLLGNIFDGIQRPLSDDNDKSWHVKMRVWDGYTISPGSIIAEVKETPAIIHKIMCPPGVSGRVSFTMPDGEYGVSDTLAIVGDNKITMHQSWPVRVPRPIALRKNPHQPLITGTRIIDTFFPIAKGGTAAIPGGFGTGKTITQHQLAKWSDADIIIYIGCGERGNEMTEVLEDFSKLTDPRTGFSLMDRTVLIANTSNMPVAAREASIYTGLTIAEYYRDMGYHVAVMADSTSRWAEALRELSGRLEEMPAEEGYPAYLASQLASFYERAGHVETLSGLDGSVTIVGAVSPQGADFSEPVTQHTKRFVRCFWALDRALAYERHFPAINWLASYSAYSAELSPWYIQNLGQDFEKLRDALYHILYEESRLHEIVKLTGTDSLPDDQLQILKTARAIRQDYLQQNAYRPEDAYTTLERQLTMMKKIMEGHTCSTQDYHPSGVL